MKVATTRLVALLLAWRSSVAVSSRATSRTLLASGRHQQHVHEVEQPWERHKRIADRGRATHPDFALHARADATLSFHEDLLVATNAVRRRVQLPAVLWSAPLAAAAEEHAKSLCARFEHSSTEDRHKDVLGAGAESGDGAAPASGLSSTLSKLLGGGGEDAGALTEESYVGENIYKVLGFDPTGTDVVDAWYAEIEDYSYGPVGAKCTRQKCEQWPTETRGGCTTGHFTQLMWQKSTELGCGKARCRVLAGGGGAAVAERVGAPSVLGLHALGQNERGGHARSNAKTVSARRSGASAAGAAVTGTPRAPAANTSAAGAEKNLLAAFRNLAASRKSNAVSPTASSFIASSSEDDGQEDVFFTVSCRYKQGGNTVGDVPFDSTTARMLHLQPESCTPLR